MRSAVLVSAKSRERQCVVSVRILKSLENPVWVNYEARAVFVNMLVIEKILWIG